MKATVRVVGMKAGGRQHVVAYVGRGDPVLLVPEPTNPHDRHAIAVYTAQRAALLHPDRLVSSLRDPDRIGHLDPADRALLLDRQAGYLPRDVAATLRLPPGGIVGYVSHVRHEPPTYDRSGRETPPTPAGFDVTADFPAPIDPDLDGPFDAFGPPYEGAS